MTLKRKCLIIAFISLLLLFSSCSADQDSDWYYDHLIGMWAESLKAQDPEIAFYGDSRVAFMDWRNAYPDSKVVNLGVGGDKVLNLLKRLPLIDALEIKTCFLAIGINDLTPSTFDIIKFWTEYDELLSKLYNSGVKVYVQTVVGITENEPHYKEKLVREVSDRVLAVNKVIIELAGKYGMEVIDLADKMNLSDGSLKSEFSSDGIHYNQAGNEAWVNLLRPYVEGDIQ